jgi:hypothetical protein
MSASGRVAVLNRLAVDAYQLHERSYFDHQLSKRSRGAGLDVAHYCCLLRMTRNGPFAGRNHLHALIVGRWAIQAMAQPRPYFVPSRLLLAARQTGYFSAILLKSNAADAQTAYASRTMRIAKSAKWRRHRFNETNLRFRPGASPINRLGRHILRIPAPPTPES